MARLRSKPLMLNAVAPAVVTSVRITRGGAGRMVHQTVAPTMAPVTTTAAAPTSARRRPSIRRTAATAAPTWVCP